MDIDERYTRGKIYKIVCNETDEVYYGSTIHTLIRRIQQHKLDKCMAKKILDRNNYYYELIEDYSCNNKYELETRERWYVENNDCINDRIPARTQKERYEINKIEKNKYQKKYYQQNKEIALTKQKEKITCSICGKLISRRNIKRHQRNSNCKIEY